MFLALALYLKGESLDPEKVTEILKVSPSKSQLKGHTKVTSTNKTVVAQTGLWSVSIDDDIVTQPLSDQLAHLKAKFNDTWSQIATIPNVEERYLDVFICISKEEGDKSTGEFELSTADIMSLQQLGIPIKCTIYT